MLYRKRITGSKVIGLVLAFIILFTTIILVYTTSSTPEDSTLLNSIDKYSEQVNIPPKQDITSNWAKVESIGGTYSIKLPDGWQLNNYPDNLINGDGIVHIQGKPATVITQSSPYAGDQRKFNVSTAEKQTGQPDGPQWQSPNPYGKESTTDFSIGNLKGKRYSIEYTETVTGVTKGDKIYNYVFDLPNNKQLGVTYFQYNGDPDNLSIVEDAIRTITIN